MSVRDDVLTELDSIPGVLIDTAIAEDLDRARDAVGQIDDREIATAVIVVCGPAGCGKSTLVNALVGSDVSTVSPVRPTTTSIVAIGGFGAPILDGVDELIVLDSMPEGFVVVDTPAWDRATSAIGPLLDRAAAAIVVVTPGRYGDESVADAIATASTTDLHIVVNRLPDDAGAREQLEDAIHERLDLRPTATFAEGEQVVVDLADFAGRAAAGQGDAAAVSPARRTAIDAIRGIASRITELAPELGAAQRRIESVREEGGGTVELPHAVPGGSRDALHDAAVSDLDRALGDVDDRIRVGGNRLLEQIGDSLPEHAADTPSEIADRWLTRVETTAGTMIRPRWRKGAADTAVRSHAAVLVCGGDAPRRVRRLLKGGLDDLRNDARDWWNTAVADAASIRIDQWAESVEVAGAFRPGALLAVADRLAGGKRLDE